MFSFRALLLVVALLSGLCGCGSAKPEEPPEATQAQVDALLQRVEESRRDPSWSPATAPSGLNRFSYAVGDAVQATQDNFAMIIAKLFVWGLILALLVLAIALVKQKRIIALALGLAFIFSAYYRRELVSGIHHWLANAWWLLPLVILFLCWLIYSLLSQKKHEVTDGHGGHGHGADHNAAVDHH